MSLWNCKQSLNSTIISQLCASQNRNWGTHGYWELNNTKNSSFYRTQWELILTWICTSWGQWLPLGGTAPEPRYMSSYHANLGPSFMRLLYVPVSDQNPSEATVSMKASLCSSNLCLIKRQARAELQDAGNGASLKWRCLLLSFHLGVVPGSWTSHLE